MATEVVQLPQMEVFHRVLELPVVELALAKSAETYSRVKDCHQLVHWAFTFAENSLTSATKTAVPIAAPIAKKFENPIHFVDHTLCLGLEKIQEKIPIVKEKPELIYANAKEYALQTVRPAVSTVSHVNELVLAQAVILKDASWNRANQFLATYYGLQAVKGIDNGAVIVDKLIDRYFPATEEEAAFEIKSDEEDKLLHTLQTVGRLSNKAARRVYSNVMLHLGTVNKDSLKIYVSSLVEFLQLTQYLQAINERVQAHTSPSKNKPIKKTRKQTDEKLEQKTTVQLEKIEKETSEKCKKSRRSEKSVKSEKSENSEKSD
ncbi:lipid storage droplets surface-binding protein 2-like [Prorops nasuta]|uniref:lipid storage droplets surface-binding protein 2-like n=1 Tax=Prorops nasuta TaxID=863751 RepID=UPI0034CFCD95